MGKRKFRFVCNALQNSPLSLNLGDKKQPTLLNLFEHYLTSEWYHIGEGKIKVAFVKHLYKNTLKYNSQGAISTFIF